MAFKVLWGYKLGLVNISPTCNMVMTLAKALEGIQRDALLLNLIALLHVGDMLTKPNLSLQWGLNAIYYTPLVVGSGPHYC